MSKHSHQSTLAAQVAKMSYPDLLTRKEEIGARLSVIGIDDIGNSKRKGSSKKRQRAGSSRREDNSDEASVALVPVDAKTDTHWDFVMKEMMWLAADFQSERKRHYSLGKKVSGAMRQFHKTKESRRVRELAEAEVKRRRLAGRIGRELKGWWTKIERVIAYKQRLEADVARQKAMDKQLVELVKLTERYGESLALQQSDSDTDESYDSHDDSSQHSGHRRRRRSRMTIEEALAAANKPRRRAKTLFTDYKRINDKIGDGELYGESTASDTGSDNTFVVDSDDDSDDETTLLEEEARETMERKQTRLPRQRRGKIMLEHDDGLSYVADSEELRKLREECQMDIKEVLERLVKEGQEEPDEGPRESAAEQVRAAKTVKFAPDAEMQNVSIDGGPATIETRRTRMKHITNGHRKSLSDPGNDADDDADASDVEDFVNRDSSGGESDGSDEFEAEANPLDDETTIEAEERLGREMSAEEEINLLQRESEMSIEELRKLYGTIDDYDEKNDQNDEKEPSTKAKDRRTSQHAGVSTMALKSDNDSPSEDLPGGDDIGDDEFQPSANDVDDETTIEAEERLGRDVSHEEEIALLKNESEIPIEDLRRTYQAMKNIEQQRSSSSDNEPHPDSDSDHLSFGGIFGSSATDDTDGDEFRPDETTAIDDETTIDAEEKLGRDVSYEEELAMLKRENEMSVEELRELYLGATDSNETVRHVERENTPLSVASSLFEEDDCLDEDEFEPKEEVDDERTLVEEEKLGREMSAEDEIALLTKESETPIEVLREMYQTMENGDSESAVSDNETSMKRKLDPGTVDSSSKKCRVERDEKKDVGMTALHALQASEERARQTTSSRPFLLSSWVKLREYQQIGQNWLVSTHARRLNGILADEMGLGKTLQTIALLAYLASYRGIWGPHLVIVPTSCIVNWETEFKRFCPAMKVLCYYGSAKRRKELRTGWTKSNWHHVIVTSYQLAVQDSFAFKRKKWYYMILDEAQNIKNFQSQRWQTLINFNSQRRLLLTGTPLQNNLMELWSLMHFLMPHVFRSRKEFSYWFSNPMNSIIEGSSSRNDELIGRLHGIIRPFVLRRLKKDVEKQMPGKFEHVVKCSLSRRQMFLYEEFMARSSTRQSLRKGGNFMGMMNVLMQLRKVCNHPDLFEPRSVITPFVTQRISIRVASCVIGVVPARSVCDHVSCQLLYPLWCGGCGIPTLAASCRHDEMKSSQLRRLETPSQAIRDSLLDSDIKEPRPNGNIKSGLSLLLDNIWSEARKRREGALRFQAQLNSWRCRSPAFPYPTNLVNMVALHDLPLDRDEPEELSDKRIISTPAALLAMRRSQQERANDVDGLVKKFVFCVPKAGASRPRLSSQKSDVHNEAAESRATAMLSEPVEELFKPFRNAHARLTSFFPDKKLVQFDAGKLQALAELLRELKRGGHRALIFTQMSKMLDILETFLNLNGHTYLRLDGGTGVDRRQRLMDRFNNDTKVFCFILSTRSGGLGINLTGADTVIFFDSDWNPAMDAQAQDRAHRIGQTRDVHIYRLVTEHTIEENILIKAQQKRNLDIMVMDEGKFDASQNDSTTGDGENSGTNSPSDQIFTKGGLRNILGIAEKEEKNGSDMPPNGNVDQVVKEDDQENMSKEQLEKAMTALEDEDDVLAMRGAQQEAAEELQEFDESIELKKDPDDSNEEGEEDGVNKDTNTGQKKKPATTLAKQDDNTMSKSNEEEMEREFAAWQSKVGLDASAIEASLTSTERYGLRFREDIEPYWSIFAINEYKRKMEATEVDEEIDPDEIEQAKAEGERRAMEEGDLLGTRPRPEDLPRQRHLYIREKARLRSNKKRRKLNGENWTTKIDGVTNMPFWYNVDTGEAIWDKPLVLVALEADKLAHEKLWAALPIKPLVHIMEFLIPFPERMNCSTVCRQWRSAACDISFVRHVLPVEMLGFGDGNLEHNHYRSIADAMAIALPGDTIELGDGHYWINKPGLRVDFPLRIVGDENDPSHVVVELTGSVHWRGGGGWIEGVTFRRPRISSGGKSPCEVLQVEDGGKVDMVHCVLDNGDIPGDVAIVRGPGSKGKWQDVEVKGSGQKGGGIVVASRGKLELVECSVTHNQGTGLLCTGDSAFKMVQCTIDKNGGTGVSLSGDSHGELVGCHFGQNTGGVLEKESGSICSPCSGNTCIVSANGRKRPMAGFRCVDSVVGPKDTRNGNDAATPLEVLPELVQSNG